MTSAYRIITIDGPAGAGKTTVSKALALKLGCIYVDTGALYRGVAYEISRQDIDWQDDAALDRFLETLNLHFLTGDDGFVLMSGDHDITGFIRTPEITMLASATSARPAVRKALLGIQRHIAGIRDTVFEGRDMGTVVFPDAAFKFFLSADLNVRAKRRLDELPDDQKVLERVKQEMETRDKNDSSRKAAPLKPAVDAVKIDSSNLTVEQVVDLMVQIIKPA